VVLCIFSQRTPFYGGHGIVGGQIPVGAGLAFADKYFETGVINLLWVCTQGTKLNICVVTCYFTGRQTVETMN
jgi:TPP-dependent pyruvate/acetoin dehydrogenase alpha subunit